MNIDPMSLVPKQLKDFTSGTKDQTIAEARFNYYSTRRFQALNVLQMRWKDVENGNPFVGRINYEKFVPEKTQDDIVEFTSSGQGFDFKSQSRSPRIEDT